MNLKIALGLLMGALAFTAGCGTKQDDHAGHDHSAHEAKPAAEAGAAVATAQATCPVMGGKINRSVYTDHEGKRIYFCCAGCDATFKKDPAKYLKKLADAGVVLEDAPAAGSEKK